MKQEGQEQRQISSWRILPVENDDSVVYLLVHVLTFSCVQQPVGPVDDDVNDGKIATEMSSTEINWELLTASVSDNRLIRLTERNESNPSQPKKRIRKD
jgi:hypothetical protein